MSKNNLNPPSASWHCNLQPSTFLLHFFARVRHYLSFMLAKRRITNIVCFFVCACTPHHLQVPLASVTPCLFVICRHRNFPLTFTISHILTVSDTAGEPPNSDAVCLQDNHDSITFVGQTALCVVDLAVPATSDNYAAASTALTSFAEMLSP